MKPTVGLYGLALATALYLLGCSGTPTGLGDSDGGGLEPAGVKRTTSFDGVNYRCDDVVATIVGTAGDDDLDGTAGDDVIVGRGGNDIIDGAGGNDTICGGTGDDTLNGDEDNDEIYGENGSDNANGGAGDDIILGSNGDDTLDGGADNDRVDGGAGNDDVSGDTGDDNLAGGKDDDSLTGGSGADRFDGDPGDDTATDFECGTDTDYDGVENGGEATCPTEETVSSQKDAFLKSNMGNRNEGIHPNLAIAEGAGLDYRPVVAFDLSSVDTTGMTGATLILSIVSTTSSWGVGGGVIDAHALTSDFTEGNGKNLGLPALEQTNGTGSGVTWNCATDTDISNNFTNCGVDWTDGGSFTAGATDSATITDALTGTVEFDVTADVLAGTTGWLVRRSSGGPGGISFYSKEGAATAGDATLGPQLVITY